MSRKCIKAVDHFHRRRFAAAARSDKTNKFTFGDIQVDAVDGFLCECLLTLENVSKMYKGGKKAVNSINLNIAKGEF
jgi:hypothetical protein